VWSADCLGVFCVDLFVLLGFGSFSLRVIVGE
jgi:hypothetical protein